ncbi:acyltransferase family protein [Sphingobium chungbukense]|uniref:Acyltransferase 3 domain-containing protein n=1 Tax=Sphingobium chungbukense TaxID=56193 RepID=A0A0M3AW79_9SPHN|nr:acyltransferase [Sphingobium chungbukense]KKW92819.1 hypothetical protein YP76_07885 [Sphingobium chungbukense]
MPHGSRRIRSVHYLRAIAALMVVIYHAFSYHLMAVDHPAVANWLKQGVGLFFGISGYVMVVSTSPLPPSPAHFLWRRVERIGPLYWTATLCVAIGAGEGNGWKLFSSLLFLPSMGVAGGPVLPVGWTLNFEMAFYILFAIFLPLPRRIAVPLLASILILASCSGFLLHPPALLAYYGQPLLLDFVAGMVIAHFHVRLPGWLLPLGFLLLGVLPLLTDMRPLTVTLPVAVILASARSLDGRLKDWFLPTLLGEASYAIYLSHLFVILPVLAVMGQHHPIGFVVAILGSVLAGIAVHRFVEIPLRDIAARLAWRKISLGGQPGEQAA